MVITSISVTWSYNFNRAVRARGDRGGHAAKYKPFEGIAEADRAYKNAIGAPFSRMAEKDIGKLFSAAAAVRAKSLNRHSPPRIKIFAIYLTSMG